MSMPSFPKSQEITREETINQILSSIAMEELALSHILNAEGEKLQYVLGTLPGVKSPEVTVEDIFASNDSVKELLEATTEHQQVLTEKMKLALAGSPDPEEPPGPPAQTAQSACGMIYDTGWDTTVPSWADIPFTSSSSMMDTQLVNSGIQVKTAGTYWIGYSVNVLENQTGHFMIGINGTVQCPSFNSFSVGSMGSAVTGGGIYHLTAQDLVTVVNVGEPLKVGTALTASLHGKGNLSLFKIA